MGDKRRPRAGIFSGASGSTKGCRHDTQGIPSPQPHRRNRENGQARGGGG